ncbi:transcriptional regulator [Sphingopyxis sp. FD7]|nr:transcriptional regulator [Sphingopyxis sp. FD7]
MSGNVNKNSDLSNLDRARAAWGPNLPRWVQLLASACDATSQRVAGEKLGKSSGYVSRLLNNCYPGDLAEAEKLVRAAWGNEDVVCPLWGPIPLASCMTARRRTLPPTNRVHHLHRSTCPTCPNNSDERHDEVEAA